MACGDARRGHLVRKVVRPRRKRRRRRRLERGRT